jgi:carboxymethylenebutenolidase
MAGSFLPWAARRGFLTAWPAGLLALAASMTPAARADVAAHSQDRILTSVPSSEGITHPSEPVEGLLQLVALAAVGLLVAHVARAAKGSRGSGSHAAAALTALALLSAPAFAEGDRAAGAKPELKHFTSGGKEVAVECFAPAAAGKHPALVTLHAVDGIDGDCARLYHAAARACAGRGYLVLLVHYFDRTGSAKAEVAGYRELFADYFRRKEQTAERVRTIEALSAAWVEVVRDAVAFARTLPNADGQRVGLVGFSLGGTVALTAAAKHDLKLAALVEFFGTLPRELRSGLKKLPPTLIFHGEEDRVVPVEQAYALVGLLSLRKLAHEAEVYPGVGHMFSLDGKELQWAPFLAARRRTEAFLDKHLKREAATVIAK